MDQRRRAEQVRVLEQSRAWTGSATLASGGMVAFLVALALLFVVSGPA